MISVIQAKGLVDQHCRNTVIKSVPLQEACGLVLAEDIYSDMDVPPFDQSAMDGYAFRMEDIGNKDYLELAGEIPAGSPITSLPGEKKTMRIFTGAPVPVGADIVVMQEKVNVENYRVYILDEQLKKGSNIRPKGSQTKKGEKTLTAGTKLNPAAISFLAGLGVSEVKLYMPPEVFIIITGKELQSPGKPLHDGQVYECNSFGLTAALKQMQVHSIKTQIADDDEDMISELIRNGISSSDLVILTGGVSVGDYDFVCKAAENAGVELIFHKVKQKPGKPIYFGKANDTLVFGLPGNPASVLTCFYEYVATAIQKMMGMNVSNAGLKYQLSAGFQKKPGLTYFLKGKISGDEVELLPAQESYQMGSFALADCLIQLEEDRTEYNRGELVEVHLIQ